LPLFPFPSYPWVAIRAVSAASMHGNQGGVSRIHVWLAKPAILVPYQRETLWLR